MKESITIVWPDGCKQEWTHRPIDGLGLKDLRDVCPGDWWIKQYNEFVCSYVFLRRRSEKEYEVLITRSDGRILLSMMYDVDSKIAV